ncbi:MAG: glycosidase, partial [Limisphaerales bacterium]
MRILLVLLSVILLFSCNSDLESQETDFIHVPSPDWSKQVIYFALTDRFNDGDPSNNDQGLGEFNPKSNDYYNGGDFQGIIDQLDYLQELGITTLWITPPVANQALAPNMNMAGYHGYWQSDPIDLDPHYGDLEAYKALSIALHKRGMYLVQDVVTNHMGNYFTYEGEFDPENQQNNFKIYPDQELNKAPWNLNDVRNKAHSEASIYNFTPDIQDYADQNQRLNYSLMALDDLNTKNPVVKEELRKAFGYWIKEVGVDGFRFDTPIYVEHDFWNDFMHSESEENPGMLPLARALGKKDFLNFGETWFTSMPMEDSGEKECKTYLGTKEKPEISSVLNFPLQATIKRVFAQSSPTSYMQYRMEATYNNFEDPRTSPTFIDNHDMARFMAGSNSKNLDQALLFLFTIPGIPIVYYGTEQHFTHSRSSMFAEGSNSEGKDHFNTQSSGFQYLQKLIEVRKSNPVFYKGTWTGCGDNSYGAGLLAYKMEYEEEQRFVIFNTASESLLATGINTGLPEGTILEPILGKGEPIKVGSSGFASLK